MMVNGDPNASVGSVTLFSVSAVVFAACALRLYWPLLRKESLHP
jgi:hypothetical protein